MGYEPIKKKARGGTHEFTYTSRLGYGGVVISRRKPQPLLDADFANDIATRLYNAGRWSKIFIPTTKQPLLYAKAGQNNDELFEAALEAMARHGPTVPYLIAGDFQEDLVGDIWLAVFDTDTVFNLPAALGLGMQDDQHTLA